MFAVWSRPGRPFLISATTGIIHQVPEIRSTVYVSDLANRLLRGDSAILPAHTLPMSFQSPTSVSRESLKAVLRKRVPEWCEPAMWRGLRHPGFFFQ